MKSPYSILSLLIIFVMLCSCAPQATQTQVAAPTTAPVVVATQTKAAPVVDETRTLRLTVSAAVETLDAHKTNNLNARWILWQMYEGLMYYNYEDNIVEPRIAKSFDMSADGLTWTFNLRTDVKFHNGETLKASDVVFSYTRAIATPAQKTFTSSIATVTAKDDATVVITLKNKVAPFLQYVSQIFIYNEKFVKEKGDNLNTAVCGTGPFKLDSADLAVSVKASAFANYYRGVAKIKNVVWTVITDQTAAGMAFEASDIDYLSLAFAQYAPLKANPKFSVGFVPTRHTIYIAFNSSKPPFNNVLVRQAISYMIDRKAVAQATFEGLADVDSLLMSPKLDGMPDEKVLQQYTYDYNPAKGLELLKQAGYDTSKEIDLGTIRTYPASHYASKPTQVIQANLAKSGIKLNIETMEVNAFVAALYGGDYTMACAAGAYGADASGYDIIFGTSSIGVVGGNPFFWSSKEVDDLFAKGVAETNKTARQEYYRKIMEILYKEAPGTGMAHRYLPVAWTKNLTVVLRMDNPLIYEWFFVKQ